MLSDYFDEYSLNARVRPSLLVILPPIIGIYIAFPSLYELAVGMVSLVLLFGLVTALAHFVRYRGKSIELQLFKEWGGKPTTYLLRRENSTIDNITKRRYLDFFESNINGWLAPSDEIEATDLIKADSYYESAIKWLLEKTRDKKKHPLIFKENISYGFRRNCMGLKWYGVSLSLITTVFLLIALFSSEIISIQASSQAIITASVVSSGLCLWWLILVNSNWVKCAAESYGIRLLASCEEIENT